MIERLIDANGNRAAEGLRALEDVARFIFNDAGSSALAKDLRHRVRQAVPPGVVAWRDTAGDVGTAITAPGEMERARLTDLIRANAARVQEALRAAEEGIGGFTCGGDNRLENDRTRAGERDKRRDRRRSAAGGDQHDAQAPGLQRREQ